jgi:hypothetical protein
MKKLLYLLLLAPIIYLSSCSKSNVTPISQSIEEVIVGKEWWDLIIKEGILLDTTGQAFDIKVCHQDFLLGSWIVDENIIKIDAVDETGLHYIIPIFEVMEYTDTTMKVEIIDINNPDPVVPTYRNLTTVFEDYVFGCMDSTAANYNPIALCTDTCIYDILGCMDSLAYNFNSNATIDNNSCCYVAGCTDSYALNYDPNACYNDGSCIGIVNGCTDNNALNYNPNANLDDGSCCYVGGCSDQDAINYNSNACIDDGSCCYVAGCTDITMLNYNPNACYDDGSCITIVLGCMYPAASNYNSNANVDDGSCLSVQDQLTTGLTPLSLFQAGYPLDSLYGKSYEGGLITYLDVNTGYGLVVTPTNYGPFNFGGAGNGYALGPQITTSLQIGAGAQNTINIMDSIQAYGNCNSPAVEFCANLSLNGYNDWFLPSGYELLRTIEIERLVLLQILNCDGMVSNTLTSTIITNPTSFPNGTFGGGNYFLNTGFSGCWDPVTGTWLNPCFDLEEWHGNQLNGTMGTSSGVVRPMRAF